MRTKHKLEFDIDDLPQKPKDILRNGFCIDDDEHHLWCSLDSVIEGIGEGRFEGVADPEAVNEPLTVDDLPKAWWKLMGFPPAMMRKMKKFWDENPNGDIEWSW